MKQTPAGSETTFMTKLKDQKSQNIQNKLNKFINDDYEIISSLEINVQGEKIQKFISGLIEEFENLWKILRTANTYNEICDGFESIITKALYFRLFFSTHEQKLEDFEFDRALKRYNFVTLKHMEVDESSVDNDYLEVAINKLSMINQFKTPKDKVIILINFVYILNTMINENSMKKKPSGADEVFPIVVYAILKSGVSKLKSNMKYIKSFRHFSRLESAEEYYFTTISSAIEFIEKLKLEHLAHIEHKEFLRLCDEQDKKIDQEAIKPYLKRNPDEIALLNYLYCSKIDESNPIELVELNQNINMNNDSIINKNLLNENYLKISKISNPIFSIDLDKLYKEYFNGEFNEFNILKLEKMFNDFKIITILIESFKQKYYKNYNSSINSNKGTNSIFSLCNIFY